MNLIITPQEFAAFRRISKKMDEQKVTEAIQLAQQTDLINSVGDFYFDIIANFENEDYQILLNGGSFAVDGYNYVHSGVKSMLADLAYSRYLGVINVELTPFGAVTKSMNESDAVNRDTLRDLQRLAQQDAAAKWQYIELYLRENSSTFARFDRHSKIERPTALGSIKLTSLSNYGYKR